MRVAWPTRTPGMSVIAFRAPIGMAPIAMPKSRILAPLSMAGF
jgi:hypothetical protein